jgi:hypothetical protein
MKSPRWMFAALLCSALLAPGCSKDSSTPTQPQGTTSVTLNGLVMRLGTSTPVAGAQVTVGGTVTATNANGKFQMSVAAGSYNVGVVATKYSDYSGRITITGAAPTANDSIYLKSVPWEIVGNTIAIPGPTGWEYATGLNNTIYFGTPNNSSFSQHFIAYDLATNTYLEKSLTGKDLCACGYNSDLVAASNKLFHFANNGSIYTPATNAWTAANYPVANHRGETGVAVYGDDIYYIGGRGPLNTCEAYNVSTNAWRTIANYPYATDWAAAVSYNGQIYVLGGASALNKMFQYAPGTNSWSPMPDIPFANLNSRPRAVVYDSKIFFFSGSDLYVYDLLASSWSLTALGAPGDSGIPVVAGTSMYVVIYSAAKSGYAIMKYAP